VKPRKPPPPPVNEWPPGLTPEQDRRDEIEDLNTLAMLARAGTHE
jgi:hypothetical protein